MALMTVEDNEAEDSRSKARRSANKKLDPAMCLLRDEKRRYPASSTATGLPTF